MYATIKTVIAISIIIKMCEFLAPDGNMNSTLKTVSGIVSLAVITEVIADILWR